MLLVGFEPVIPATELPKTHALYCTATGIDERKITYSNKKVHFHKVLSKSAEVLKI
jgi:hypothetical protein